jgi:hypothetical protein
MNLIYIHKANVMSELRSGCKTKKYDSESQI